ncbi:NUDIX domain-containing protein [Nocardioides litoris]|uniref:NUDIX domain-containing protein n=1 Tax=Nocardioides litoris TaxID=1926648 RepID=UPI0011241410|nr:NUDIX domain-containing protein [Nocardioides litoris]
MHYTEVDTRVAAYAVVVDEIAELEGRRSILLTWFNGEGRTDPSWSLPGGGIDYGETVEEGLAREVVEEAGYDVAVGAPLLVDLHHGSASPTTGRLFRAVRLLYAATVTGGELGTTEVGGSTDFARWVPLEGPGSLGAEEPRARVVDLALGLVRGA